MLSTVAGSRVVTSIVEDCRFSLLHTTCQEGHSHILLDYSSVFKWHLPQAGDWILANSSSCFVHRESSSWWSSIVMNFHFIEKKSMFESTCDYFSFLLLPLEQEKVWHLLQSSGTYRPNLRTFSSSPVVDSAHVFSINRSDPNIAAITNKWSRIICYLHITLVCRMVYVERHKSFTENDVFANGSVCAPIFSKN